MVFCDACCFVDFYALQHTVAPNSRPTIYNITHVALLSDVFIKCGI